ncbi:transposase [Arcticibacterium luteifluviistationis]|uniref:transposase n=1 Tax=Arcticibacterium luteifluviistationis TaxID=1784714 RepID=UPI0013A6E838
MSASIRDIKANSSKWINEKQLVKGKFEWQEGFGAFTLGHSQLPTIINYIKKQEEHHSKKSFKEEYLQFLNAYEVDYKEAYLFDEM